MEDIWKFYTQIDFTNKAILQFHIDTRDFHCSTSSKESEKRPNIAVIKKYPDRFFYTDQEVAQLLTRYFDESGGAKQWRFFSLDSTEKGMDNWNMKYIRIHRYSEGLLVCNNNHRAIRKDILSCKVDQKHLSAY